MKSREELWRRRNDEGLALEKAGRPEEAIRLYEANLEEGCDKGLTYDRLAALYRARVDTENEARVIERALSFVGPSAGRFASLERRLVALRGDRAVLRPRRRPARDRRRRWIIAGATAGIMAAAAMAAAVLTGRFPF